MKILFEHLASAVGLLLIALASLFFGLLSYGLYHSNNPVSLAYQAVVVMFDVVLWSALVAGVGLQIRDAVRIKIDLSVGFKELSLPLFWPFMRFYNVIALRWRLILTVAIIAVLLAALCVFLESPIYSATVKIII